VTIGVETTTGVVERQASPSQVIAFIGGFGILPGQCVQSPAFMSGIGIAAITRGITVVRTSATTARRQIKRRNGRVAMARAT
jgi:hypothetical protein